MLQQLSENQLKHQVEKMVLNDSINSEAKKVVTTVSMIVQSETKLKLPVH